MSKRSNFLDGHDNAHHENLRFVRNELEENLQQYFGGNNSGGAGAAPPRDSKLVTPMPGYCIKTSQANTGEKYFINVCQTEEIPPPQNIDEKELTKILRSDAPSAFRIPMSISEPRTTKDKSGQPADVCDIAVNPKFLQQCCKSGLFRDFFLALIAEALNEKYNVQISVDKAIVLNNRKFMGTLVSHRIRNNDVKMVLNSYQKQGKNGSDNLSSLPVNTSSAAPLIQELNVGELEEIKKRAKPKESLSTQFVPEYKLRAKLQEKKTVEILAEFYMPECVSAQDLTVDIGEDRIIVESNQHNYLFDRFVDFKLKKNAAKGYFDKTNKMLQVRIPVINETPA